jgi:hypothetical protein
MKHGWAGRILPVLVCLALAAYAAYIVAYPQGGYLRAAYCSLWNMARMPRQGLEILLPASSFDQTLLPESMENAVIQDADTPGWQLVRPRDPAKPATVDVRVRRERPGDAVFYPRISGTDSSVAVFDAAVSPPALLFRLVGQGPGWTPIGRQYLLPLCCAFDGWKKDVFFMVMRISLQGPGAQLWMRDGKVFF